MVLPRADLKGIDQPIAKIDSRQYLLGVEDLTDEVAERLDKVADLSGLFA